MASYENAVQWDQGGLRWLIYTYNCYGDMMVARWSSNDSWQTYNNIVVRYFNNENIIREQMQLGSTLVQREIAHGTNTK